MAKIREIVDGSLVRAYTLVAFLTFVVPSVLFLLLAAKLVWPDLLGNISFLSYGRLRVFHTNVVIYGWLGVGFFAILNYIVPKLANRPLFSDKLAWVTLYTAVSAVGIGLVAILFGGMQGVEYAEMPWYADVIFAAAFLMAAFNYLATIFLSEEKQLYVSSWYFILGLVFTTLNFVMANTICAYLAPGAAGAAITGLWIHNAVGLFITPIGVGIVYFLLPVMTKKPVHSHLLSLIGFWALAFFYPLGGSHHYYFSPIPWWVQALAVPLTAVLFVVVVTVIYNWFKTLHGSWHLVPKSPALAFIVTGMFSYMLTCTQGPFHNFLTIQKIIHFTDWIVAHAHLALYATFTYFNMGALLYIWPRVTGKQFYKESLNWSGYWLMTIGYYLFYFIPLTASGLIVGYMWITGLPFSESVISSVPFWMFRLIAGFAMVGGFCMIAYNFLKTYTDGKPYSAAQDPLA